MRKFLVVVAILAVTGGLAQLRWAQAGLNQNAKATPNVAGKWNMTLEMSMGTGTPVLELKQDGEKITGTYSGRYGTFPLEGTLKGQAIEFWFTMSAEGQSVSMSFTGEVAGDGQTMSGQATLGELGDATWSAKKEKTDD